MRKKIIYVHGLASGSDSRTGELLKKYLNEYDVICPEIPIDPISAYVFLRELKFNENPDLIIGTSLGGFFTMMMDGVLKLAINPAMTPAKDILAVGMGEHPYFSNRVDGEKTFNIDKNFVDSLLRMQNKFYDDFLDDEMEDETYFMFGSNDELFSHRGDYSKYYRKMHARFIDSNHRLSEENIKNDVVPYIKYILNNK